MISHAMIAAAMLFAQDPTEAPAAPEPEPVVAPERIAFGPLWLGMSFDEARAAVPAITWEEKPALLNPAQINLHGQAAVELFGRSYDVEIKPGVHGASRIDLHHAAPGIGLRACQALVVETVAALEPRFGPFQALPSTPNRPGSELVDILRKRGSGDLRMELPGFVWVSAGTQATQVLDAGTGSRVNFFANPDRRGNGSWQSVRLRRDDLTVGVGAGYSPDMNGRNPTCDLYILADYEPPRPESETIAFEDLQPVWVPTIGQRHVAMSGLSAEDLAALPEDGRDIDIDCMVQRRYGGLMCGLRRDDAPEDLRFLTAARAIAQAYGFSTDNLQPESDIPLNTRMTVRLKASDRIPLVVPDEGTMLPSNRVRFVRGPNPAWLSERARELSAGVHTMKARCQVQADGSLTCGQVTAELNGQPNTGYDGRSLQTIGARVISILQVAPELADGSPSVGCWFDFSQTIRVN